MNPARPCATHVAVREGRILAVGSPEELSAWGPAELDTRFAEQISAWGRQQQAAGLLSASDAALLNTAVARAADPVEMARAFALAIDAGRRAHRA